MRTILVLVASFFVALSSSAAIARPSFQIPECNVTMPCDFSGSQLRHGRYQRPEIDVERRASYRNAMAAVDKARAKSSAVARPVARIPSAAAAHPYGCSVVSCPD
jgi:hypothetical protein